MTLEEIKGLKPFPYNYGELSQGGHTVSGYMIGYSRKFFTLWYVQFIPMALNGNNWNTNFIQNIIQLPASEEDTVAEMFPDLDIDLSLRGNYWHPIKDDFQVFRFGKYKGTRIDECTDGGYLKWYIGSLNYSYKSSTTIAKIVSSRLYQLGYSFIVDGEETDYEVGTYGGYWISPISKEHRAQVREALANGTLDMSFKGRSMFRICDIDYEQYGLDKSKDYCCCTSDTITYVFEGKFYPASYYASDYYLPMLKGKAKRVKGKQIRVTAYKQVAKSVVLVEDFVLEDLPKEEVAQEQEANA